MLLVRKGQIIQLNEDHSVAPYLDRAADAGKMMRETALNHRSRNTLTSAVTGEGLPLVDRSGNPFALYPGDVIVIASDGVDTISHDQIGKLVADGESADTAAEALLTAVLARQADNQDNASLVVAAGAVKVSGTRSIASDIALHNHCPPGVCDDAVKLSARSGIRR